MALNAKNMRAQIGDTVLKATSWSVTGEANNHLELVGIDDLPTGEVKIEYTLDKVESDTLRHLMARMLPPVG